MARYTTDVKKKDHTYYVNEYSGILYSVWWAAFSSTVIVYFVGKKVDKPLSKIEEKVDSTHIEKEKMNENQIILSTDLQIIKDNLVSIQKIIDKINTSTKQT